MSSPGMAMYEPLFAFQEEKELKEMITARNAITTRNHKEMMQLFDTEAREEGTLRNRCPCQ